MSNYSTKAAQRQSWHEITGIDGTWATGGAVTYAPDGSTKVRDGGQAPTETLFGQPQYSDMSLTRPYDQARDPEAERTLRRFVAQAKQVTVTRFDADADGAVKNRVTYKGRVMSYTSPDTDSMANTAQTIGCTISIDSAA